MPKYLYGASVKGIQSFIFQSGKLKEIAGASELIEQVCTKLLAEQLEEGAGDTAYLYEDHRVYQAAAGAIKCLFETHKACQDFVKDFAFNVQEHAPGLELAQASLEIDGEEPTGEEFDRLEQLLHLSRNQPQPYGLPASMAILRSRRSGLAAVKEDPNEGFQDLATQRKLDAYKKGKGGLRSKFFGDSMEKQPNDFNDLAEGENTWMAVIHADGNGLGKMIMGIQEKLRGAGFGKFMKQFSRILDEATRKAVQNALRARELTAMDVVPIILGGDDVTLVMKSAHALRFTEVLCQEFEKQTQAMLADKALQDSISHCEKLQQQLKKGLTLCAGIAYIKVNYPVHYGLKLSEVMCKEAKKASKKISEALPPSSIELPPSSIMFHKVGASFVEDFKEIKSKELTSSIHSFKARPFVNGPYFLHPQQQGEPTIDVLRKQLGAYQEADSPASNLRQWLGEMYHDKGLAEQHLERICQVDHEKKDNRYQRLLELPRPLSDKAQDMDSLMHDLASRVHDLETLKAVKTRL